MEHYKLTLTKGQVSVEISSHDKGWVETKEKEYRNCIEQSVSAMETPSKPQRTEFAGRAAVLPPAMPVNEFYRKYIHEKKINSRPEIVTFFVYYLSRVANLQEITSTDVKNLFKEVQYPGWNNINVSDALGKAKKKALLNNMGNLWSLTITGEDYVLNSLSDTNA